MIIIILIKSKKKLPLNKETPNTPKITKKTKDHKINVKLLAIEYINVFIAILSSFIYIFQKYFCFKITILNKIFLKTFYF